MHKLLALILMLVFALTFAANNIQEADSVTAKSAEVSSDSDDGIRKEQILLSKLKSTAKRLATAIKTTDDSEIDCVEDEIELVIAEDDLANVPEIELVVDKNETEADSVPVVLTFDPIEYYPNGHKAVTENEITDEATPNVDETDETTEPTVIYLDPIEYYPNGEHPVCEDCASRLEAEQTENEAELKLFALETEETNQPTVYSFDPIEYYPNGEHPVCEQCAEICADNAI